MNPDGSEPQARLIHRDETLVAACKPPGWETIVEGGGRRCFSSLMRRGLELPQLAPVHRLDRDTSGVQLFAVTREARKPLEKLFRQREVHKDYLAICLGAPRSAGGTINRPLSKWRGGRRPVQVAKGGKGLEAVTRYRLLRASRDGSEPQASLLLFRPHHGRTHQIRVHAAALGRPILGDDQYGERPANAEAKQSCGLARQALHAWRVAFTHPAEHRPLRLEAPLPEDLAAAADYFFPDWRAALKKASDE